MGLTKYKHTKDLNNQFTPNIHLKNVRRAVFKEAAQVERYPFYAMPIPTLLKQSGFRPHQELLAEGLITQSEFDAKVRFRATLAQLLTHLP